MLVVDLLHEVELGVWKNLFVHLLRILNAKDPALVNELDRRSVLFKNWRNVQLTCPARYRQVPTFGRDTIRKFSANCSEMKKMAARDFEDLLQVCKLTTHYTDLVMVTHKLLVCHPRLRRFTARTA